MPRRRVLACVATALTLLAAACTGGGAYRYESNKSAGVYFKVPKDWAELDKESVRASLVLAGLERGLVPSADGIRALETILWNKAWDSSATPDLEHFKLGAADAPVAIVNVRRLLPDERGLVALDGLRNSFYPEYTERREEEKQMLRRPTTSSLTFPDFESLFEDEIHENGYTGVRQIFKVRHEDGSLDTVAQIALVDSKTTQFVQFVLHCNSSCFTTNQDQLAEIIKSFTVREV